METQRDVTKPNSLLGGNLLWNHRDDEGANADPILLHESIFLDRLANGTDPGGLLSVTFADVGDDRVLLTMDATNLGISYPETFVDDWVFNLNAPLIPSLLTFEYLQSSGPSAQILTLTATTGGANMHAGDFDFGFTFQTSNSGGGGNRFSAGETVVYKISGTGLTASAFKSFSTTGEDLGGYITAAHVQGIPGALSGSVAAVPEPSGLGVLAILGSVCFSKRGQRCKRASHPVLS